MKQKCLLPGKSNTKNVIYKAIVTSDKCVKTYTGSTGQSFKKKWYGHCSYSELRIQNAFFVRLFATVQLLLFKTDSLKLKIKG